MKSQQKRMPSSPLTILTLWFLSLAMGANAQACSEVFAKLAEQRNITNCKRLRTMGMEFAWSYRNGTNSSTVVEILFGAPLDNNPEGWIAWGVNPGKRAEMIGTRAIIGIKRSDGKLVVDTFNVTKETRNGCNLLPSNIGLAVSNTWMKKGEADVYTIHALLNLPSEEYNVTRLNHVWQVGYAIDHGHPLRHPTTLRNVDSTEVIDLTSASGQSTGQYRSFLRSVHGILNIIGWGTLLPIGVIIARYFRVHPFKRDPMWFNLHIGCQLTAFLVGTAGWAIGISLGRSSRYYTFHTHRTFGILIFTFSTVQMLAFRLKPKETDDYRKYWNMYHHFLGYGLVAIIIINIFKGISILEGGDAWNWVYIGNLAFLGTIAFGLEVFTWISFFIKKSNEKKHGDKSKTGNASEHRVPQTQLKQPNTTLQPN